MERDPLTSLEQRLRSTEEALEVVREQLGRLHSQRRRWNMKAGLAGALAFTVFWIGEQAQTTYAQNPAPVLVAKAPFVVVDDAGKPVMAVMNDVTRSVKIFDTTGAVIADLGDGGIGTGSLKLHSRSFKSGAVMTVDSQGGSLQLETSGRNLATINAKTATLSAPFRVNSNSGIALVDVTPQSVAVTTALRVRNAAGADIASIADNEFGGSISVGSGKAPAVVLGKGSSGTGFLLLRNKDTNDAVAVGAYDGRGPGMYVLGADGKGVQASLALDSAQKGQLVLGAPNEAGANVGVGASGVGFLLLRTKGGTDAVALGSYKNTGVGMHILGSDGTTVQATLGLDAQQQGILRVGSPTSARGVIGRTKSGGVSFALYDTAGDAFRVGMLAAPDSSFVRLNSNRQEIQLNVGGEGGAVHLFNGQGKAAASLISTAGGFGQFTLGNSAGDTLVQAGTTTDGLGVVRAGPRLGGVSGISQGGLVLPHSIVGQK